VGEPDGLLRSGLAPAARTLADVLAATVAAHGDAPAIDDGSTVLTYAELDAVVRAAAAALAAEGIGPGSRVGVRVPSGTAELYTAILAVLAAGAAYVPVDVDDPDERAPPSTGCSPRATCRRWSRPGGDAGRPRPRRCAARGSATTPGSSSRPGPPARPRAWP